jgi:hypothetical protein
MKVYQGLAKAFAAEGTSHVFGMMGDGNMYGCRPFTTSAEPS